VKSLCEQRVRDRAVDLKMRRGDAYAALQWLARQPGVDATRLALLGRSNGASTVLSALDRSDAEVRAQRIQPRAAIAFYPGCRAFAAQRGYALAAPLLLMIGELDDWTPAPACVELHEKLQRGFELVVYPGSHHGFDGISAVRERPNLPTKSGKATVGANPDAGRDSQRRMFEFLSARLE
jgi:dienelactone hydrolase